MANCNLNITVACTLVALSTGYLLGKVFTKPETKIIKIQAEDSEGEYSEEEEEDPEIDSTSLNDIPGEVRMALVIRTDLGMTKGKVAAQCAHAALGCYRLISNPAAASFNEPMLTRWLRHGQAKITLKCPSKEDMDMLYAQAISMNVNAVVIHDAGRTQIEAGSATVLGLGPAPKAVLDQLTGELKLY